MSQQVNVAMSSSTFAHYPGTFTSTHYPGPLLFGVRPSRNTVVKKPEQKPKRKRAPRKAAPHQAKKAEIRDVPFLFSKLPAEIRVMVYKHLLVESSVELSYRTGGQGKGLARGCLTKVPGKHGRAGHDSWVTFKPKHEDDKPTPLQPAILRVCKFIRAEAIPLLYDQTFYFENPLALKRFLARITPSTLSLLRKIVIRGWAERNIPCWVNALALAFAMLTTAHNLESVRFDRKVSGSSDQGFWDQRRFPEYLQHLAVEDLKFWIQYVNSTGGKKAAEILSFSDINFGSQDEIENDYKVIEERKKVFFKELQLE
ncbi:hypothetical protein D6D13_05795 [Aureobasidium pullulans]|uniref:DUF7730 domain-containing protein n=1 Tax=Aureobasidium pullulans TaxID=5580 RepID=A0A4S9CQT1_AURPU|nr:hypothetical protein D6D13_05795 [Aureobasidium pullulans]